jgi:hypothetical protein
MLTNQLESDCLNVDKHGLFKMFSTVLGINLAALISIIDSFNAICMHCFVLKWFYEHIFIYLFNYTASFTCQKQPSPELLTNNLTTLMAVTTTKMADESTNKFMLLLEITTHLIYFFMLKLIVSNDEYRYCSMLKGKFQNVLQHLSSNGRYGLAKIGVYYLVFYVFAFVFVYLTLATSQPPLKLPAENKCEHFFKNKSSQSVSNREHKKLNT